MPTVVGVKLRFASKVLWFDPAGATPEEGDSVIVSTERGQEFGEVAAAPHEVESEALHAPLKPVVRVATDSDRQRAEMLRGREREEFTSFRRLVAKHGLDMKPIGVEHLFDDSKVVFYFAAEERVDFRDLVRDLAAEFHNRIDMRQVGVRDEARMVGGLGHCGQQLCCSRFAGDFQPVSIRMAKEQDLPLNPLKISGLCGRLMCCLRYEYDAYKDFKQRAPKCGTPVETPTGNAKVVALNCPRETVTIRPLDGGQQMTVPLESLDCSAGRGCPCVLKADAVPALAATGVAHGTTPTLREADRLPESNGESRPPRSRRKKSGPKPEGQEPKAQEPKRQGQSQKQQQPRQRPAKERPAEGQQASGSSESGSTGETRRRRRRRPRQGGDTPPA
ncbi:MAG: stage 0 sporulation family protein [Coriobacteriia bacterium]|nr:stage 0 sporulation family protein [Coriobacteriia bacterium]